MFFFNNCHSCCCNRQNDCVRCRPEPACGCNMHNDCHGDRDCRRCDCCRDRQSCCCKPECSCGCRKFCCCCKCCNGMMPFGMNGTGNGGGCGGHRDCDCGRNGDNY